MDHLVNQWQEYASLAIVGLAVAGIARHLFLTNKAKHRCSSCALMEQQQRKHRT